MASSITRQAWDYQQKLIDEMGEALGDVSNAAPVVAADAKSLAGTCGKAALVMGLAGLVVGRVGFTNALVGIGATYLVLEGLSKLRSSSASSQA